MDFCKPQQRWWCLLRISQCFFSATNEIWRGFTFIFRWPCFTNTQHIFHQEYFRIWVLQILIVCFGCAQFLFQGWFDSSWTLYRLPWLYPNCVLCDLILHLNLCKEMIIKYFKSGCKLNLLSKAWHLSYV